MPRPSTSGLRWGGKVTANTAHDLDADCVESDIEHHIGHTKWATLNGLLASVLHLVCCAVPGTSSSSITLVQEGTFVTRDSTDEVAETLDLVQYEENDGPCIDAITRGEIVSSDGREEQGRWKKFCDAAERLGIGGSLSIPLRSGETTYGALTVYTARTGPAPRAELDLARALAVHISNALALIDATALNLQLTEAIDSRQVIGEAKGIVMESTGCTREEAFDILRRASQRSNRKLREVAQDIVEAAERRARDQA